MGGSPREEVATEDVQMPSPIRVITSVRWDFLRIVLPTHIFVIVLLVWLIFFRIRVNLTRVEHRSGHASRSSSRGLLFYEQGG